MSIFVCVCDIVYPCYVDIAKAFTVLLSSKWWFTSGR